MALEQYGVQRSAEELRGWLDARQIEMDYVSGDPGAVLTLIPAAGL